MKAIKRINIVKTPLQELKTECIVAPIHSGGIGRMRQAVRAADKKGAVPEGAAREGGRRLMTVRLLRRPAVPRRRETAGLNPPMLIG
jgi:hypothetical protein